MQAKMRNGLAQFQNLPPSVLNKSWAYAKKSPIFKRCRRPSWKNDSILVCLSPNHFAFQNVWTDVFTQKTSSNGKKSWFQRIALLTSRRPCPLYVPFKLWRNLALQSTFVFFAAHETWTEDHWKATVREIDEDQFLWTVCRWRRSGANQACRSQDALFWSQVNPGLLCRGGHHRRAGRAKGNGVMTFNGLVNVLWLQIVNLFSEVQRRRTYLTLRMSPIKEIIKVRQQTGSTFPCRTETEVDSVSFECAWIFSSGLLSLKIETTLLTTTFFFFFFTPKSSETNQTQSQI